MNVLKNYSDTLITRNEFKCIGILLLFILFFAVALNANAAESLANTSSGIDSASYFKVLFGLVFVIALFLISTFLFKRFGNGPMLGRGQLRVVDGLHLGNRERLMLVEIKGKQILLAITPGKISKLDILEANDEASVPDVPDTKIETLSIHEKNVARVE